MTITGNQRADALANKGREAEAVARPDEADWLEKNTSRTEQGCRHSRLVICTMHYGNGTPEGDPYTTLGKTGRGEGQDGADDRFTPHERKTLDRKASFGSFSFSITLYHRVIYTFTTLSFDPALFPMLLWPRCPRQSQERMIVRATYCGYNRFFYWSKSSSPQARKLAARRKVGMSVFWW